MVNNNHWQEKVKPMLNEIKVISEKKAFVIGITFILIIPVLLFLMSYLVPINNWVMMLVEGIVCFFCCLIHT